MNVRFTLFYRVWLIDGVSLFGAEGWIVSIKVLTKIKAQRQDCVCVRVIVCVCVCVHTPVVHKFAKNICKALVCTCSFARI